MRRERRLGARSYNFFYIVGALIIALVIILIVLYRIYNNKLNDISKSMLSTEEIIGLVPNISEGTESASSILSKTVEEVKEDLINNTLEEETTVTKETLSENEEVTTAATEEPKVQPKKQLEFVFPVQGDTMREFATETLVYSDTLEEWTTHQGIDIKADRTTVVKAAEEGTIVAIKNDPRFGLTVIIEHEDGFKTVYSNLLTTEFVSEDEHVEKGQTIGTVGNSAAFEIADEPHLHFEIIKNGEYVDPKLFLK